MGKPKRFNAYDSTVKAKRLEVQSYGAQRQRLSINSSFRGQPLEPPIATVLSSDESTGTGTFCSASLAADQTTNIAATDHIEFDTLDEDGGITLQTGVGQADGIFELSAGKKYYLTGAVRPEFSGATGQLVMAWYDITNTAELGKRAIYESQTHASNNADQPKAEIVITPTTNITIEFRIIAVTALTALATEYSQVTIFEIALGGSSGSGSGGGGSGVSFPITPTINDHGNVATVTEDLDLSAATGHVHKITLTGDPTLTFSNPPSSGTQIEFEIEFVQDATGSRTVTWPATVAETVSISKTASSTTIVTVRTNDGGTTYHAIPALRGSISLSGGSNYANTALSNLVSPTLTTDLNFNTQDITNMDRVRFASDSGGPSSAADPSIFLDGSSNFQWNVATTKSFILTFSDVAKYNFDETNADFNAINVIGTGAVLAETAATSDIGSSSKYYDRLNARGIQFRGNDLSAPTSGSVNSIRTTASSMAFNMNTASHNFIFYHNGTETFAVKQSQISVPFALILGDGVSGNGILSISDGISITSPANGYIYREGADVKVYTGGSEVNLSTVGASAATPELDNLGTTAINADLLFDAATYDMGDSTNFLENLYVGRVRLQTSTAVTNKPMIYTSTGNIFDVNFPSGSSMVIRAAGVAKHTFSSSSLTTPNIICSNTFTLSDNAGDPNANGMFARNGTTTSVYSPEFEVRHDSTTAGDEAILQLVKEDSTPQNGESVGAVNFTVDDDGVDTIYGSVAVENIDVTDNSALSLNVRADNGLIAACVFHGDDNNQRIMMLGGGTDQFRIQPVLGQMGYFCTTQVTDFSLNIGTSGSLEIPQINDGSPSLTDLNSAFGAFDGAIGYDINDGKLYVRKSSSAWSYYSESGTVT